RLVAHIDADELGLVTEALRHRLQVRSLLPARRAGRVPEVDDHGRRAQIGQGHRLTVDGLEVQLQGLAAVFHGHLGDHARSGHVALIGPGLIGQFVVLAAGAEGQGRTGGEDRGEEGAAVQRAATGPHAPATVVPGCRSAQMLSQLTDTSVDEPNVKLVIEARSHSRRRGSWTSERPSPHSRVIQIGSWCETMTPSASGPYRASLVRKLAIEARMRSTICRYGSPQDGCSGLYRSRRIPGSGSRRAPSFCASNEFAASITRSSVNTGCSSASASGSTVCWVRSSGEATSSTGAVSAVEKCFATRAAIS